MRGLPYTHQMRQPTQAECQRNGKTNPGAAPWYGTLAADAIGGVDSAASMGMPLLDSAADSLSEAGEGLAGTLLKIDSAAMAAEADEYAKAFGLISDHKS